MERLADHRGVDQGEHGIGYTKPVTSHPGHRADGILRHFHVVEFDKGARANRTAQTGERYARRAAMPQILQPETLSVLLRHFIMAEEPPPAA